MGAAPSGCRTSRQSISSPRSARSKAKQISTVRAPTGTQAQRGETAASSDRRQPYSNLEFPPLSRSACTTQSDARVAQSAAYTTLRACATLFRARDPAGAGDGPWCGARRALPAPGLPAMRRSFSSARVRATQCQSTPGTADAMGERASDEPLPAAIEDAVAAAIEDGATMDEIVARVRPRDATVRRSAEGRMPRPWTADRRSARPFALPRNGCAGPRGLAPSSDRDPANAGAAAMAERAGAAADRGPRPSHAGSIARADRLRIEREQAAADAAAAPPDRPHARPRRMPNG